MDRQKTTLYLDKELHHKAKIAAVTKGRTLTQYFEEALEEKINRDGLIINESKEM